MRVISGTARGTKLNSIQELSTRPTLDRVKESLFNILQPNIQEDSVILDLFSGSGAIAIEFLSRGAKEAYLCEKNQLAIKMIYSNLKKTRLEEKAVVIKKDYKKALEILQQEEVKLDFIYLDPPYEANIAIDAVKRILSLNLLNEKGNLIIETDDEKRELLELKELNVDVYDIRKYGRVSLIFLRKK
jgi:16S rRNA (guanine966-N2)-methyltransferase